MRPLILAVPFLLASSAWADEPSFRGPPSKPSCECPDALTQGEPHRVSEFLASGWEIRGVASGPKETLVLQKGDQAVICQMAGHMTVKGVEQVMTASCAVVR
jgi:hypothetical protein